MPMPRLVTTLLFALTAATAVSSTAARCDDQLKLAVGAPNNWDSGVPDIGKRAGTLVEAPVMAINETKQYTELLPNGKAWQFFFPQEIKSFITRPSPGLTLKGPGFYEISGLAYSGNGPINKVEVSADGGKSWALAALDAPVLSKSFARFRMPWNWNGQPAILQSRATDEAGNVQPM